MQKVKKIIDISNNRPNNKREIILNIIADTDKIFNIFNIIVLMY